MSASWTDVARHVAAWVLGIAATAVPWIAIRFVPVEVNKWASIYIAGALGGLALEMLLGRGRLELPSPSVATAKEQKEDERRPLGPMLDLGFLARVSSSGIAAVALLLVYHALVDGTSKLTEFNQLASDPSTFGWAVFLGASSPAIWTASQRMVKARIDAVTAANSAQLEQKKAEVEDHVKAMKLAREELAKVTAAPAGEVVAPAEAQRSRVLADIEQTIAVAADAEPQTVDVSDLSLNLFGRLPMSTSPPAPPGSAAMELASVNKVLGILDAGIARGRVGEGPG